MTILANLYEWLLAIKNEEKGQGMVEYALILVLVSIAAIAMLGPLGEAVAAIFEEVTGSL